VLGEAGKIGANVGVGVGQEGIDGGSLQAALGAEVVEKKLLAYVGAAAK
jgi:hypothetical protein